MSSPAVFGFLQPFLAIHNHSQPSTAISRDFMLIKPNSLLHACPARVFAPCMPHRDPSHAPHAFLLHACHTMTPPLPQHATPLRCPMHASVMNPFRPPPVFGVFEPSLVTSPGLYFTTCSVMRITHLRCPTYPMHHIFTDVLYIPRPTCNTFFRPLPKLRVSKPSLVASPGGLLILGNHSSP